MAAAAPSAWWHGSLRLQCEGFLQARGKLHCFFWPSLGSHIVSLLLHFKGHKQVQTHPDSEGKELDCTCWWGHRKILENRAERDVELQPSLENTMCYKMKQIRIEGDLWSQWCSICPQDSTSSDASALSCHSFPNFSSRAQCFIDLSVPQSKILLLKDLPSVIYFFQSPHSFTASLPSWKNLERLSYITGPMLCVAPKFPRLLVLYQS